MIYVNSRLEKANKKVSDFISWICDNKREHALHHLKDQSAIELRRNGIDGKLYIHPDLEEKLNEFIKE